MRLVRTGDFPFFRLAAADRARVALRRGRGETAARVLGRGAAGGFRRSIAAGGFTPGAILAERYRIIGLLGRGGMGEVYRADDLKLGQPVALKFLPEHLSQSKERLERFLAEVRIARQVSHPNVCRVYDIGEVDGQHFLSMEYVDGEDLASLLRASAACRRTRRSRSRASSARAWRRRTTRACCTAT